MFSTFLCVFVRITKNGILFGMKKGISQTRREFLMRTGAMLAVGMSANSLSAIWDKQKLSEAELKRIVALPYEDARMERRNHHDKTVVKRLGKYKRKLSNQGQGKWRIHMLGTWCGSEPNPKHNHTSWILEKPSGELLWFDAGEYCSWTASNMNLDILQTKNIFLSHPHLDHIGGFTGLMVSMHNHHRLENPKSKEFIPDGITVYASDNRAIKATEIYRGGRKLDVNFVEVKNGEIYRDNDVAIEAVGNYHMPPTPKGKFLSFSYRIKLLTAPHKTIIFSGDIKSLDDMQSFFNSGVCDLLMVETGHHLPENHCINLKEKYPNAVKDILFLHHGTRVALNMEFEQARVEAVWGKPIIFSQDKQTIEL